MADFVPRVKKDNQAPSSGRSKQGLRLLGKKSSDIFKRGIQLMEQKRYDQALEAFDEALLKDPTSKGAHICIAGILFSRKRYDEALRHAEEVIRLDPFMPQAFTLAGKICLASEEWGKASDYFQDLIRIDPKSTAGYLGLGNLLLKLNRYDEAIAYFRQAIDLDPYQTESYLLIARAYKNQGNIAYASTVLKNLIEFAPDKAPAYVQLGSIYLEQGKFYDAKDNFEKTLSFRDIDERSEVLAKFGLAEALVTLNLDLKKAEKLLKNLPNTDDIQWKKYKLLGDLYTKQKRFEEASNAYELTLTYAKAKTLLNNKQANLKDGASNWQESAQIYKKEIDTLISS
jgi:tetratricopeptide (TPR) repeat protein